VQLTVAIVIPFLPFEAVMPVALSTLVLAHPFDLEWDLANACLIFSPFDTILSCGGPPCAEVYK